MGIRKKMGKDKFAELLGIKLIEANEDKSVALLEIKEKHLNGHNIVHGGTLFTLADFAMALSANYLEEGVALSINADIKYFKTINSGTLYAECKKISSSKKLSHYSIEIKDEKNNLIAFTNGFPPTKNILFKIKSNFAFIIFA